MHSVPLQPKLHATFRQNADAVSFRLPSAAALQNRRAIQQEHTFNEDFSFPSHLSLCTPCGNSAFFRLSYEGLTSPQRDISFCCSRCCNLPHRLIVFLRIYPASACAASGGGSGSKSDSPAAAIECRYFRSARDIFLLAKIKRRQAGLRLVLRAEGGGETSRALYFAAWLILAGAASCKQTQAANDAFPGRSGKTKAIRLISFALCFLFAGNERRKARKLTTPSFY